MAMVPHRPGLAAVWSAPAPLTAVLQDHRDASGAAVIRPVARSRAVMTRLGMVCGVRAGGLQPQPIASESGDRSRHRGRRHHLIFPLRMWPGIGAAAALAREITALYVVACGRVNTFTTEAAQHGASPSPF